MFAHLHMHTEYSLLDGANRISDLITRVKELGMTACAITDHGVMYGVADFYKKALAEGIHPVIGCEVYVCPDMNDKQSAAREYSHLILLCETQEGYLNLIKLVSEGFTRGFYYRPRVDYDTLKKYSKGLIAMSACLSGDIPKLLLDGRTADAEEMALRYLDIFGRGNFFIELQDHGMREQKQILPGLAALAKKLDIPMTVTNDCHYLNREDAEAQEILMCIQTGKTLSDETRMRMNTDQLYVKSEEEMRALFPGMEEAIENTQKIADRCHVEFDFSTRHLPRFLMDKEQDHYEYLRSLCLKGYHEKYGDRKDALDRLNYELDVINGMGFVDYFLIVWDFVNFAKSNGILVGPGRGSGAGSIAAYTLNITAIDPLRYNLLFERFLNPERVTMPDIDIDFDYERRGEVIEYVARRYGADHVAQIITFGTMAARAVIRDVGRVLDIPYHDTDTIAKMVPFELNITLKKAMELNPEFKKAYDEDPTVKRLIDISLRLEGLPRHASTHAAGVLITEKPVSDYVPLQTNDDVITTQFPMGTIEALGLLKMDFLGLRTLNVIGDTIKMTRECGETVMDSGEIPLDDAGVYKMISDGDTDGVFQLESTGMRNFLTNMKPHDFEDIIAAISLYRPGPMESIPRYIAGKQDPSGVVYETEKLRPILDVTYGCMVYQEQVMQIVRDLAGYSYGRSDLVRRAMAKKKHDVMAKEKEYFVHGKLNDDGSVDVPGAVRMGVDEAVAEKLFDDMSAFASYAFNKSHAAAYAYVAVQTAYLKLHYPVEFMAAMMNSIAGNTGKIAYYIQYCRRRGIKVLPPDINFSELKFSVERQNGELCIRFGMGAVKSTGHAAAEAIAAERRAGGPYKDINDFVTRVAGDTVNKKTVESLIRAGALDSLPGNRAQKLAVYELLMDGAQKQKKTVSEGQISLFATNEDLFTAPPLPNLRPHDRKTLLQMEKEVTGIYITGHPLDEFADILSAYEVNSRFLEEIGEDIPANQHWDQSAVRMGGIITEVRTKATKSGGLMAFVTLEDLYGSVETLVFPRVYEKYAPVLQADRIVTLTGKLSVREDDAVKLLVNEAGPLREYTAPQPKPYAGAEKADPPKGPTLYLKLTEAQKDGVSFILSTTPGDIRTVFYCDDSKKTYIAPRSLWVSPDFDRASLTGMLGEKNVILK